MERRVVLVLEHMPKRDRTLPTKIYRVVERPCGPKGMLSEGWQLLAKNLTLASGQRELKAERARRQTVKQDMKAVLV